MSDNSERKAVSSEVDGSVTTDAQPQTATTEESKPARRFNFWKACRGTLWLISRPFVWVTWCVLKVLSLIVLVLDKVTDIIPGVSLAKPVIAAMSRRVHLVFFPYPIGPNKALVDGKTFKGGDDDGDRQVIQHSPIVLAQHVIFIGWVVSLVSLINMGLASIEAGFAVPMGIFGWVWGITVLLTLLMLANWNRTTIAVYSALIVLIALVLLVLQLGADAIWGLNLPIYQKIWSGICALPMGVDLGLPVLFSTVLGLAYWVMVSWQSVSDWWKIPARGNYLKHHALEQSDDSINKAGKNFKARYDCLLKKNLVFGYGKVEVTDSSDRRVVKVLNGLLFAEEHESLMDSRFSTTDVNTTEEDAVIAEEDDSEDEDAANTDDLS